MPTYVSPPKTSGTKTYTHLTGDTPKEVTRMAEKLHVEIPPKQHGELHVDLNPHKTELAVRYGAVKKDGE